MKRKHPNTIPMEEMTQDLLDKAYSCEMSKKYLFKIQDGIRFKSKI